MTQQRTHSLTSQCVVRRSPDHLSTDLDGETILMSIPKGKYFSYNEVGSRIWQLIEQPRSIGDLCAAIVEEYEVERNQCEADVIRFLERAREDGLVEILQEPADRGPTESDSGGGTCQA